jgi:HK97 family phage prohead protease
MSAVQTAVFPFVQAKGKAAGKVAGQGATWGLLNDYSRVFVPGSLQASIRRLKTAGRALPMGYQHSMFESLVVVGAWTEVVEDEIGLQLRGSISDTAAGRDAATLVRDDAISGISIGFRPGVVQLAAPNERVTFQTPFGTKSYQFDTYVEYMLEADLAEASLVSDPADDGARISSIQSATLQDAQTSLAARYGRQAIAPMLHNLTAAREHLSDDVRKVTSELLARAQAAAGVRRG